jgi:class 3 adenylate cyclase/tetratricopeptide (TPR) repeat protein
VALVTCGSCGAQNSASARFCAECGSPLPHSCTSCGAELRPGQRFCDQCGTPVALTQPPTAPGPGEAGSPPDDATQQHAERRICSVLFCDLVGFTPLSEARDPEDVRELLSRYFDVARTVIGRYGGIVEKFIGDAVMAVWGTPSATEQDAERAVRAALDLIDAVDQLGREAGVPGLAARAGVVTGSVAVTVGASGEGMVAGDAVNTAARVQASAEPGAVLVDEGTWRVAQAGVGFTPAGDHVLKGKAAPVQLWRAERVLSGVGGVQRIDGLEAPFVGRDSELRLVKELFHACEQRRAPRLVSVTAAAGIGKSRLAWEFEKYLDGLAATVWWHRGRCLSYGDGVAFWALAEMVRQRLQIAEEDSTLAAAEKLSAGLEQWLDDPAERDYVRSRLSQLLGVESVGDDAPRLAREELFAGWRLFFERLAATAPVVMVLEDLQHADAGMLDFLEHLLEWTREVPVFVLTLARPELETRRPGWGTGRRNRSALTLDPLDDGAMQELLDGLVPGMPAAAQAAIANRAEGIPLYAVETVRMLIDRDVVQPVDGVYRLVGDVGELTVPATLQSLLAARLDSLDADARALVADAAVLGGSFPVEALIAVSERPEAEVRRLLAELVRREVLGVRADPLSPERGHYGFVQTMFRQVAYDTLSRRERKARHLAVAAHLRAAFADEGEEIAEVIATHLIDAFRAVPDDADVPELQIEAVGMLTRAADRAIRTGAPTVAEKTFTSAAEILQMRATPEAELAAAQVREQAGAQAMSAGDVTSAKEHYEAAAAGYRSQDRIRDAARADMYVGAVQRRAGHLEEARERIRKALTVLSVDSDADYVRALGELASVEAFAGKAAEAERLSAEALSEAQALGLADGVFGDLFVTRGIAHGLGSRSIQAAANFREAVRRAEAAHDTASAARALLNLGDALGSVDPKASAEASRAALTLCRRVGNRYLMGVIVANLIQALVQLGEWDEAREVYHAGVVDDDLADDRGFEWGASVLLALSGDRDRLDAVLATIGDATEDPQDRAATACAFAVAAALSHDHAEALTRATETLDLADAIGPQADSVRWAWPIAADAALAMNDLVEVERLLDWLSDHRPGHVPAVLRAARQRVDARLLAARSEQSAAPAFDAAVKAHRDLGSPYHLAVCLLDAAEYQSAAGDSTRAHQLAAEAGAIAATLGAQPLMTRAGVLASPVGALATAEHQTTGSASAPST